VGGCGYVSGWMDEWMDIVCECVCMCVGGGCTGVEVGECDMTRGR